MYKNSGERDPPRSLSTTPLVFVIVISEFLERHSNARRTRAPVYSRAQWRFEGVYQRV